MSVSQNLTDMHTACLNRLVGAFWSKACEGTSLDHKGYHGFLDPSFESPTDSVKTDFLGVGHNDAQHFKVVGAKSVVGDADGIVRDPEHVMSELEELSDYQKITSDMVESFLTARDNTRRPDRHEPVALLPVQAYDAHRDLIDDFCEENEVCVWCVDINETNKIEKRKGKHDVPEIDELVSDRGSQDGIYLQDIDSSLCPIVRESDMKLIKFKFAQRLITYSYREQTTEIPFDKIDEIMMGGDRPLLGHLPEDERENYWQQCMLTLRNTLEEMEDSREKINTYQWEKERFLYDKSARSNLIEDIRSGLGIGEEA